MKTHTDINQSKKLAEILPIESADMYYKYYKTVLPKSPNLHKIPEIGNPIEDLEWYNKGYTFSGKEPLTLEEYCIPCWSLAALLDIIRKKIGYTAYGANNVHISCELGDKPWEMETKEYDNEVDACYEMVLKLYELKLI